MKNTHQKLLKQTEKFTFQPDLAVLVNLWTNENTSVLFSISFIWRNVREKWDISDRETGLWCLNVNWRNKKGVDAWVEYEWEALTRRQRFFLLCRNVRHLVQACSDKQGRLFSVSVWQRCLLCIALWVCLNTCSAGKGFSPFLPSEFLIGVVFYVCSPFCVCVCSDSKKRKLPSCNFLLRKFPDVWSEVGPRSIFFFFYLIRWVDGKFLFSLKTNCY